MKISKKGLRFLKKLEGCSLSSYRCQAGVLTIGYGHTENVIEGMKITEIQAEEILLKDLESFEEKLTDLLKVEVKQREFDALLCLSYNIGLSAFANSTVLKKINNKSPIKEIMLAWILWDKITVNGKKKVCTGLKNRRFKELAFYNGKI